MLAVRLRERQVQPWEQQRTEICRGAALALTTATNDREEQRLVRCVVLPVVHRHAWTVWTHDANSMRPLTANLHVMARQVVVLVEQEHAAEAKPNSCKCGVATGSPNPLDVTSVPIQIYVVQGFPSMQPIVDDVFHLARLEGQQCRLGSSSRGVSCALLLLVFAGLAAIVNIAGALCSSWFGGIAAGTLGVVGAHVRVDVALAVLCRIEEAACWKRTLIGLVPGRDFLLRALAP